MYTYLTALTTAFWSQIFTRSKIELSPCRNQNGKTTPEVCDSSNSFIFAYRVHQDASAS